LRSSGTESSRSRTIASGWTAAALSIQAGLWPGTNKSDLYGTISYPFAFVRLLPTLRPVWDTTAHNYCPTDVHLSLIIIHINPVKCHTCPHIGRLHTPLFHPSDASPLRKFLLGRMNSSPALTPSQIVWRLKERSGERMSGDMGLLSSGHESGLHKTDGFAGVPRGPER
jgi:hypothetical protein